MASLKKNIFYNSIQVASNLIFPLITFPYVTRVFGPDNLGLFNYITSIVGYFTLFASLGFPLYGTREIAQVKNDPKKLQDTFSAIFTANLLSCLLIFIVYILSVLFVAGDANSENLLLYLILGLSILMSCVSLNWFYQGVEDFKYITTRSICIKVISIVCLFVFVKHQDDLLPYAILTIAGTCGNNILNLIHIRKYTKLRFSLNGCWKHTKGASILFLGTIAVSLYTNLNSVMVGSLGTMAAVAYFVTGNRLVQMLMSVLNAITSTIIPRMSYLVGKGDEEQALSLQRKSLNLILYLSIPMALGIIALAEPIILIFGGNEFIPSVKVMQLLAPLLVIITLSGFLGHQVLIPLRLEKYGNYCVIIGASVNLILNFFLIKLFAEVGVAISVLVAESSVTIMHFIFARKYTKLKFVDFIPHRSIIASIVMFLLIKVTYSSAYSPIFSIFWILGGIVIYVLILLLLKDRFVLDLITNFFKK